MADSAANIKHHDTWKELSVGVLAANVLGEMKLQWHSHSHQAGATAAAAAVAAFAFAFAPLSVKTVHD